MRKEQTTMSEPVHLSLPTARPESVSGCRDCLDFAVQRINAVSTGDQLKASDVNVSLRAHLRSAHGGR
jgi:hypothetical protein